MRIESGKDVIECNALKLRGRSVLVKYITGGDSQKTESGIVYNDDLRRYNTGEILLASDKAMTESGIKQGDVVLFEKNCGIDYTVNGTYCILIQSKNIYAVKG